MSRQRITTIGSVPLANSDATASRRRRSPSFSSRWISTRWGASALAAPQAVERLRHLLGRADEDVGQLDRLLHRRLDGVETERVGHLFGVIDDVVERGREPVPVGRVERQPGAAGIRQPMDHVVGDPVALVLALANLGGQRGALGVVGDQVA